MIWVPTGTRSSTAAPSAPRLPEPPPLSPRDARKRRLPRKDERSRRSGSATTTTAPPVPPSPPSGPPRGTYFSRRKLSAPCPPRPASTRIFARSWNTAPQRTAGVRPRARQTHAKTATPGSDPWTWPVEPRPVGAGDGLVRNGHEAALAARAELDLAVAGGEDRVVAADVRAGARAEPGSALAHDDHPGLDLLAGTRLDAEILGLGVAAVPRRAHT